MGTDLVFARLASAGRFAPDIANGSEFSVNLKQMRLKRGLTLQGVEKQICISYTQIRRWESGKTSPSIDNAALLAKFYKVSLDELYGLKMGKRGLDVSGLNKKQMQAVRLMVECFREG